MIQKRETSSTSSTDESTIKVKQEVITEVRATLTQLKAIETERSQQIKAEQADRAKITEAARKAQVAAEKSAEVTNVILSTHPYRSSSRDIVLDTKCRRCI